jgi:hypothetical protein
MLGRALRRGLLVSGTTDAAGRVAAVARLSAKDARRYRVGRVVARRSGDVPGGPFALTLKPSRATARKLGRARRLKVTVEVTPAGGAPTRTTVTLKR